MDFEAAEESDGVRFTFNVVPSTIDEARRAVAPVAAMYKPLFANPAMSVLPYDPVMCGNAQCRAVLNPHCYVDWKTHAWTCRICLHRNALPPGYRDAGPENLPVELRPGNTTVEYVLKQPVHVPPVFMFVVDTCQEAEDLQALKDSLIVALSLLPRNALVGLVSFGTMVHLHELPTGGAADPAPGQCLKTRVFNGAKHYEPGKLTEQLGFMPPELRSKTRSFAQPPPAATLKTASQFLAPVGEYEFELTQILEQLLDNPFAKRRGQRDARATGEALSVALAVLEAAYARCPSRLLLFAGGPCTHGPGAIVTPALTEPLRSHHDIHNEQAKHFKEARKFYDGVAARASANGTIVDVLGGCYDQVGLEEMRGMAGSTGGRLVLTDSFRTSIFKQSFIRLFGQDSEGFLDMGFCGTLQVHTTQELKLSGLLGHAASANRKSERVAETEVGVAGTDGWNLCGVSPRDVYAIVFDVVAGSTPTVLGNGPPPMSVVQFVTQYVHATSTYRMRVTTVARPLSTPASVGRTATLAASLDQECVAAVLARMATEQLDRANPVADVVKWLDSTLVRVCKEFATYTPGDPASFRLPPTMTYLPQFLYHLRRSQFLQVFNNSPDETTFYRHVLNSEDVTNASVMIQPTLTAYALDQPEPEPVLLDALSLSPDRVLLLDTYFHILIYHGETIAAWRRAGYQDQDEYANLRALLEAPRADAAELLADRFPLPRFIDTEAGGSQARFLLSRLNPSRQGPAGASIVLTDDVPLQDFMQYLINLVVKDKH